MPVADFFIDKNVFVTGGSGFLGKVLIEKLLRSCPGIGNIYVLLRPKRSKSIEERLEKVLESPIFNPLRHQNPDVFKKLIPIKGDVSELNLGINKEDRELLVNTVNIIYHSAASVRFDDFLKDAIILNVRGTREVAKLALDLKNISIFVHISTAYSNCDKLVVEEKLYPAHANWRDAITIAEECDPKTLQVFSQKYIFPLPNTYTFAKSLGEHVVNELCQGKIPVVITRPSVGVIRIIYGNRDAVVDYIPADYVIKGIILATESQRTKKLVRIQRRIYIAAIVLLPFMTNTYSLKNDKFLNLQKNLKEEDSAFSYKYLPWTVEERDAYMRSGKLGMEAYLLKSKSVITGAKAKRQLMNTSHMRPFWVRQQSFYRITSVGRLGWGRRGSCDLHRLFQGIRQGKSQNLAQQTRNCWYSGNIIGMASQLSN
ncbi:putative fatty acyl-CoA reductase CG5065 isoform X7 [Diabrotica virgifera virgifera]|uniref:Fatty acyl-CoA reductase n=1 Tax=Diabrotica virgifera virgifera TaxID=50390 RepID=A0ABM5KU46_DIAVI|nr:putative fatty acyl-CoA reductase CG5065 isoform X7 [Diabrotica virgifera virgifera]